MATNKNIPPPAQFVDPATGFLTRQANNFLNSITRSSNMAAAGEVATPAGSGLEGGGQVSDGITLSIAPAGVTNAMLRDSQPYSVIGRYSSTAGSPVDITATADDRVLARMSGVLAFYPLSAIPAVVADGDYGDITVSGTGTVWTIDANVVTDAKFRQSAALSVVGRSTNSTGNVADIAAASDGQVLRRSGTSIGFGAVSLSTAAAITGTLPVGNGGTGITAFGTGVATALGVNVGSAGAFVTFNGALGTPSSGTLTNCTGLPNASVVGLGTAATVNTGTSGATIPLLNGANTWSGAQTHSAGIISSVAAGVANFQANQNTGSIAVNGTYDFAAQTYGLFFIAETAATGQMALCCTDGVNVRIIYQSGSAYTTTLDNAGTVNLYYNSGTPRIQNKLASAATFNILDIKVS